MNAGVYRFVCKEWNAVFFAYLWSRWVRCAIDNTVITHAINQNMKDRLILHNLLSSNKNYLDLLVNLFSSSDNFSLISSDNNIINLKIKKSNVKKDTNYNNDIMYFYNIIDMIMVQFINQINLNIPIENIRYMYTPLLVGDSSILIYL